MLYTSAAMGFKSGEFNGINIFNTSVAKSSYGRETNWPYEIGVKTDVDLRKASIDLGKAAAKFGPDIGHIATLLRLSLKDRAQQKSDRGNRCGHLSRADPCALAHCPTLTADNRRRTIRRTIRLTITQSGHKVALKCLSGFR